jgi:hypothetical protein
MQGLSREQIIAQRRAATADFEAELLGKRETETTDQPKMGGFKQPRSIDRVSKRQKKPIKELDPKIESLIPDRLKTVDRELLRNLGLLPKVVEAT